MSKDRLAGEIDDLNTIAIQIGGDRAGRVAGDQERAARQGRRPMGGDHGGRLVRRLARAGADLGRIPFFTGGGRERDEDGERQGEGLLRHRDDLL